VAIEVPDRLTYPTDDVHAGRGDVRLDGVVADPRPAAGEVGELVLVVHRADGQCRVRAARRADRRGAAGVAGRDHEQRAVRRGQVLDGLLQRVDAGQVTAAETQVDHRGQRCRPFHAGQDGRFLAPQALAHLADDQLRAGRHPAVPAAGPRAAAGDDRGDVRAVPDLVVGRAGGAEVLRRGDPAGEVRVGGIDAAVQHRHLDAGAVQAGPPGGGRADLRDADVQADLALAVQVDPVHPGRQAAGERRTTGQGGPELGPRRASGAHRERVDAGQIADHAGGPSGGRACATGASFGVRDQQRQFGVAGVAEVAQRGEVEQPLVEPVVAE
jgi:hypothetical protein